MLIAQDNIEYTIKEPHRFPTGKWQPYITHFDNIFFLDFLKIKCYVITTYINTKYMNIYIYIICLDK